MDRLISVHRLLQGLLLLFPAIETPRCRKPFPRYRLWYSSSPSGYRRISSVLVVEQHRSVSRQCVLRFSRLLNDQSVRTAGVHDQASCSRAARRLSICFAFKKKREGLRDSLDSSIPFSRSKISISLTSPSIILPEENAPTLSLRRLRTRSLAFPEAICSNLEASPFNFSLLRSRSHMKYTMRARNNRCRLEELDRIETRAPNFQVQTHGLPFQLRKIRVAPRYFVNAALQNLA